MSVKFEWNNNKTKIMEIVNEIDLTFFYGIHPYFISCKLSEPSADALRELSMYPSYFGGNNSKSALVFVSKVNKQRSYTYTRAHDMGICVIDGHTIKSGKFISEKKNLSRQKNNKNKPTSLLKSLLAYSFFITYNYILFFLAFIISFLPLTQTIIIVI